MFQSEHQRYLAMCANDIYSGSSGDESEESEDNSDASNCPYCQDFVATIPETKGVITEEMREICLDCIYKEHESATTPLPKKKYNTSSCELCYKTIEEDEPEVQALLHLSETRTIDKERKDSTLTAVTLCYHCYEENQENVVQICS